MRETVYALVLAARFDDAGLARSGRATRPSARHRLRPPHSERLASTRLGGLVLWREHLAWSRPQTSFRLIVEAANGQQAGSPTEGDLKRSARL